MKKIIYLFLTLSVLTFNACGPDDESFPEKEGGTNETPIATDSSVTIEEENITTFTINPTDSEDDVTDLIITINSLPENGTLTFNGNSITLDDTYSVNEFNSIIFEASEINEDTTTSFQYTVIDTNDTSDNGVIKITITNYLDPILGNWYEYSYNGELSNECASKSNLLFEKDDSYIAEQYRENDENECVLLKTAIATWEVTEDNICKLTFLESGKTTNYTIVFSEDYQKLTLVLVENEYIKWIYIK